MKKSLIASAILLPLLIFVLSTGCDKEKTVESTKYVYDTKYIETPADTVFKVDTVYSTDSVNSKTVDTVRVHDTVHTTVYVHDTVVTVRNHYDTVTVVDTVTQTKYTPSVALAINSMQSQTDPLVLELIYENFGVDSGWVMYLSNSMMDISQVSTGVYDIYGVLEYWTTDWSSYYPIEFYWRMTYKSGDPAIAGNWTMSDPSLVASARQPGIKVMSRVFPRQQLQR